MRILISDMNFSQEEAENIIQNIKKDRPSNISNHTCHNRCPYCKCIYTMNGREDGFIYEISPTLGKIYYCELTRTQLKYSNYNLERDGYCIAAFNL